MNTKCGLCKFTPKGKRDMERHITVVHKLDQKGYEMAVAAVRRALTGIGMVNSAMRKAGMLVVAMLALTLGGCRGVDRLLGQNDDHDSPPAAAPVSALGSWSGNGTMTGTVVVDETKAFLMNVTIPTQTGGAVSGTWALLVEQSDQPDGPPPLLVANGTIEGTIDAAGAFTTV